MIIMPTIYFHPFNLCKKAINNYQIFFQTIIVYLMLIYKLFEEFYKDYAQYYKA